MLSLLCARTRSAVSSLALVASLSVQAQSGYAPQAGEYSIGGPIPGDQVYKQIAIGPAGGILVFQDNFDTSISAQRLNNTLSGTFSTFRINEQAAGLHQNPRVALLNDGGAVVVWQGGQLGMQHIYARIVTSTGTFAGGDIMVNSFMGSDVASANQLTPVVTRLNNGNVVVIWASMDQDGDKQGVYGRVISPTGEAVTDEFRVNQKTVLNQRTPSVSALAGGGFVVTWVCESVRGADPLAPPNGAPDTGGTLIDFDVYGRVYGGTGVAGGAEFKVNTAVKVCANPSVAGLADGGFLVGWSQLSERFDEDPEAEVNSWDVVVRKFNGVGVAAGTVAQLNTYTYGDQYAPVLSALGNDVMAVWTSLARGVYGRVVGASGEPSGAEFKVNTASTLNDQFDQPAIGNDGSTRFLVVWSRYVTDTSFDMFAQRYASAQPLPQLPAPFASALSQSKLVFSWAPLAGYSVVSYGVYLDGSSTPINVTSNSYTMTGLAPGSAHTARIDYLLVDDRRGVPSPTATGSTWGEDNTFDGLPDDWQALYWGANPGNWPLLSADSDGDGVSNVKEYLSGTSPVDASSVLRIRIESNDQGWQLSWNTEPGLFYQVQVSSNFTTWSDLGGPRFSAGNTDSMIITSAPGAAYYQVKRIR